MFGVDDAALASIASGLISTAGSLYANKQNIDYQTSTNKTNWQIAALNNATQIDMANTAHQREVKDLQAAGLNPILSTGGSGSSTPSLTSSRGESPSIENPVEGLANSAKSIGRYLSRQYKAETDQAEADADYARTDADILRESREVQETKNIVDRMNLQLEMAALDDLAFMHYYDGNGKRQDFVNPHSDYFKRYKEGLKSDAVVRSRQSARNLYSDILSGINSASKVADTVGDFVGPGKYKKFIPKKGARK